MITIPGRIPVIIQPWFWVLAAFIGWINTASLAGILIWVAVIFISILVHEYGHAFTAVAFKQRAVIQLMAFGGITQRQGPPLKLWQEFFIVLNGPLAGFALYYLSWIWATEFPPEGEPMQIAVRALLFINLFWTVLNLFPILPLDGGHLMRIVFEAIIGVKGIKAALWMSVTFAIVAGVGCLFIGQILPGVLFMSFAFDGYSTVSQMGKLARQDRDAAIVTDFQRAEDVYRRGHNVEALLLFQELRLRAKEGMLFNVASQYVAEILERQGRLDEAYQTLLTLREKPSDSALPLWHRLAYENKDYQAVLEVGDHCYQVAPSPEVAFMNAVAHAAAGAEAPTIGWLQCASREGMSGIPEAVLSTAEFNALSGSPSFKKFLDSI